MYPRVKVRADGEKVVYQEDTTILLLRVVESFSLESNSSSKVADQTPGNRRPLARISKSHNPRSSMPQICIGSKDKGNTDKNDDNDNKPNIRASSVPRPRAVLSSPVNDGMIGNINKRTQERPNILKTQSPSRSTLAERKPAARSASAGRVASRVRASKEDTNSNNPKEMHPTDLKLQRQSLPFRKEKLISVGL